MTRKGRKVAKKFQSRRAQNPWPIKIAALIVSAIKDLRETKGSSPRRIIDYINFASNADEHRVKRQVKSVLKRGVEYGILKKHRGQYFLPMNDDLNRANRAAQRFASLPLPPSYLAKSNTSSSRKIRPLGRQKVSSKSGVKSQTTKHFVKPLATLISPTVSLTGTIGNVDDL